jgi:hypothetical protein
MPKKIRKKGKKVVYLPATTYPTNETTFCGFRIIKANHNRLWRWDTLEDV